jgi:hypothetical protein
MTKTNRSDGGRWGTYFACELPAHRDLLDSRNIQLEYLLFAGGLLVGTVWTAGIIIVVMPR